MASDIQPQNRLFKIKLDSGRVLGPLDLDRVRLLILKGHIVGTETARIYPEGDWKAIHFIPELAELLFAKANGTLAAPSGQAVNKQSPVLDPKTIQVRNTTQVLPPFEQLEGASSGLQEQSLQLIEEAQLQQDDKTIVDVPAAASDLSSSELLLADEEEGDRTQIGESELVAEVRDPLRGPSDVGVPSGNLLGRLEDEYRRANVLKQVDENSFEGASVQVESLVQVRTLHNEKTVVFERSADPVKSQKSEGKSIFDFLKIAVFALILGVGGYFSLLDEAPPKPVLRSAPIRPSLPSFMEGKANPKKSVQLYTEAMKDYILDTVVGYRSAAEKLKLAASYDINNVKALAMLSSAYLNLIDSSNKDESYFTVISKLIEMSRAKAVDLPETVIADVEFFLVVNKAEAAENRVVEYTKTHSKFGIEMFYYLALAYYGRGDFPSAAKYIAQFPDDQAFSPKIFYLRGLIAEKLNDFDAALKEYRKAIRKSEGHAKSHLRIADLTRKMSTLKEAGPHLDYLTKNSRLLDPKDLALAYYLHGLLMQTEKKMDIALGDLERAVKLDAENHDYLLELYTLRAKAGDTSPDLQKQGRMYYFLGEAEKLIQQGKYQESLVVLLQARNANFDSPLPLLKLGDMFTYLHDVENSKMNYKLAADRAPDNIQVWSKYIGALIHSYEWEEASKAMDRLRKLPVGQSSIDKAAGDMYQKMGRFVEAQLFYKKAMARDSVDSDVYVSYAKSLMSSKNYKDAPFFFALALRFDPLNVEANINIARCIAETESIDRGISMLQDELKRGSSARAEYLAAIAELLIRKGSWDEAQLNVEEAKKANADYAYPWKLQAQIYMHREGLDRNALDQALFSYKSYSERNPSDPTGYLERYKILTKKFQFDAAKDELARIYAIYPKYPSLHYYLGALYAVQGNHQVALEEFKKELANNKDSIPAMIAYGKELIELGNPNEALVILTKAMQLAPSSPDAKQNAAWANRHLKNYAAAVALFQNALLLDKGNPTIYKRLGITFRDMGDVPSACGAFRKYLEMEPEASDRSDFQGCF